MSESKSPAPLDYERPKATRRFDRDALLVLLAFALMLAIPLGIVAGGC